MICKRMSRQNQSSQITAYENDYNIKKNIRLTLQTESSISIMYIDSYPLLNEESK